MKVYFFVFIVHLGLCISNAQTQNFSFAGCDYSQGIVFVMENNKIVWQHKAPESNDIWVLPNGNILFTVGKGVLEMTRQNDTVFYYHSKSPVFACQRLANGNTFIGECDTGRMLEVSPEGKIVKEACILPEEVDKGGFAFMRNARRLDNGNFLVAHYGGQTVKEYDPTGKEIWMANVPGGPHSIIRLPNGNTLVAVADMTQNPRIVELDKTGNCIWEFSNKDIEGSPLKFLGGMQYFEDGRILFTNWTGHVKPEEKNHMFMINKEKQVLFIMKDQEGIETMSSVYCFDNIDDSQQIK
ncbi:MAG: aryl-sulfate sulfotransferase, partial [Prevotella sp.]|nr:aryl-sulfate sulfotransferase [Prevotella sp.]